MAGMVSKCKPVFSGMNPAFVLLRIYAALIFTAGFKGAVVDYELLYHF
jgi:hypothetical protein